MINLRYNKKATLIPKKAIAIPSQTDDEVMLALKELYDDIESIQLYFFYKLWFDDDTKLHSSHLIRLEDHQEILHKIKKLTQAGVDLSIDMEYFSSVYSKIPPKNNYI
jgi:hypothetical protein